MVNGWPYFLLLLIYGCLALLYHSIDDKRARGLIQVSSVILFIIFFGLRGFIFYDWKSYFSWFASLDTSIQKTIQSFSGFLVNRPFEPLFTLLGVCCKIIYDDYHFFVFVCTSLNLFLLIRFFTRNNVYNLPLALLVFLSLNGIYLSTDLMRCSIALFLFANALEYIPQKKPLKYFFICIVACGFHISSIIYFPLYFILGKRIPKWLYITIFTIINIVYIFRISILGSVLSLCESVIPDWMYSSLSWYYKSSKAPGPIISLGYLERFFSGVLVFLFIDKLRQHRKNADVFINSFLIFIAFYLCFFDSRVIGTRFAYMLNYSYWILWIDLISCFTLRNNKILFVSFVAIYCFIKTFSIGQDPFSHYENILFKHSTYQEKELFFRQNFNLLQKMN